MPIPQKELKQMIEKSFPDAQIDIVDLAGDDDHYSVTITDESFNDKSRIEQHKLVHKALDGDLGGRLHAMQLKTVKKQ